MEARASRWLLILSLWLLVWELGSILPWARKFNRPSQGGLWPPAAPDGMLQLGRQAAGLTLLRIIGGYFSASPPVIRLLAVTARFGLARDFLTAAVKATPVASFILLMLLWVSSAACRPSFLFPDRFAFVWSNVYEGLKNVDWIC